MKGAIPLPGKNKQTIPRENKSAIAWHSAATHILNKPEKDRVQGFRRRPAPQNETFIWFLMKLIVY